MVGHASCLRASGSKLRQRIPKARIFRIAIGNRTLLANLDVIDRMDLPARDARWVAASGLVVFAGMMTRVEEKLAGHAHDLRVLQRI